MDEIIKKIESYYQNDPEFKETQEEVFAHTREFFDQEMENKPWQSLPIEKRIIQVILMYFTFMKEGKTKQEALSEIKRLGMENMYDPIAVEGLFSLDKKGFLPDKLGSKEISYEDYQRNKREYLRSLKRNNPSEWLKDRFDTYIFPWFIAIASIIAVVYLLKGAYETIKSLFLLLR